MPNTQTTETQVPDATDESPSVSTQQGSDVEQATDGAEDASLESPVETESQSQEGEEGLGTDDQPVAPVETKSVDEVTARYATLEKENTEMKALMRQVLELNKAEKEASLSKQSEKAVAPKGVWKEKLGKHFQANDAAVLSEALEAAVSERLGDMEALRSEVGFMKPWLEKFGVDHEMQKGANALISSGVPQSVVAALRPQVDEMIKSGFRAPAEVLFSAAYAKHAMKDKAEHAKKTLEARTPKKPVAPVLKNTTGAKNPKYTTDKGSIADLLKQFEQYK